MEPDMKNNPTDYSNFSPAGAALSVVKKSPKSVEETDPFRQLIEEWLDVVRSKGRSEKTISDYSEKSYKFWWWWTYHTRYAETLGAHPRHVTRKQAREFVVYLRSPQAFRWGITDNSNNKHRHELSPESVASYGRTIKTFFNWLVDDDYIELSPFSKKSVNFNPGKRDAVINRLDENQLELIFSYLLQSERLKTFCGKRDLAIFALLLDSGIRRGELIGIEETDLELTHDRLYVKGKTTRRRYAFFRKECNLALQAYCETRAARQPQHPALWLTDMGEPLTYAGFAGIIRRTEKGSGVTFHAHQLRHTFASILAQLGIDPFALKDLLGHRSIVTTQIYVTLNPDRLAQAHKTRSPLATVEGAAGKMRRKPGRPKREE
jgi:site-specific recombinase XerD